MIKSICGVMVTVVALWLSPVAHAADRFARLELTAAKRHDGPAYFDASRTLPHAIRFSLPSQVPVIAGASGGATLTFRYGIKPQGLTTCRFRGSLRRRDRHVTVGAGLGAFYQFNDCDNGAKAGDIVSADTFELRVNAGDRRSGSTAVRLRIDEHDSGSVPLNAIDSTTVDRSVPTSFAAQALQLYDGSRAIQRGVRAGAISPDRVAIVSGRLISPDGTPLSQATVSVAGHPEYGTTYTDPAGVFRMAVEGGYRIVMKFEFGGATTTQGLRDVAANRLRHLSDVVLLPGAPTLTSINTDEKAAIQVARGSDVSDDSGIRSALLLFPPDNVIEVDGVKHAGTIDVKISERSYGVGGECSGVDPLPPTSACTYAVDVAVTGATPAVADPSRKTWKFSKPVVMYVENFLKFPFGLEGPDKRPNPLAAPLGYFDEARSIWIPAESGVVLNLLTKPGADAVDIDLDGDGVSSSSEAAYSESVLGITLAERKVMQLQYASLHKPLGAMPTKGKSVWRVKIDHFSEWDINWGVALPSDGGPPTSGEPAAVRQKNPTCHDGSQIECENLVLGEAIPVHGTPFSLHYRSDRAPGWKLENARDIPVADESLPASVKGIELVVTTDGNPTTFGRFSSAKPGIGDVLTKHYAWNGKNGAGIVENGEQYAVVDLTYFYNAEYADRSKFGYRVSGRGGGKLSSSLSLSGAMPRTRGELRFTRTYRLPVGHWDATEFGMGGWSLGVHHVYSKVSSTVYKGDGGRIVAGALGRSMVETIAAFSGISGPPGPRDVVVGPDGTVFYSEGNNVWQSPPGSTTKFAFATFEKPPVGLAVGPTGVVYVAVEMGNSVWQVVPDPSSTPSAPKKGFAKVFAGAKDVPGAEGDGGPVTSARLTAPSRLAAGADGSVYIVDQNVIRVVDPAGTISRLAGVGPKNGIESTDVKLSVDGDDATAVPVTPRGIAVGSDGTVYFTEASSGSTTDTVNRIRRIGVDGKISTFAGAGPTGESGDGGPARLARLQAPTGIAVGADGAVYVGGAQDGLVAHPIRRVGLDGVITTVAGAAPASPVPGDVLAGDRGPALGAYFGNVTGIAISPRDGVIYVAEENGKVRRFMSPPHGLGDKSFFIADPDGRSVYSFSTDGRHCATYAALTAFVKGAPAPVAKYTFEYTDYGVSPPVVMSCTGTGKNLKLTSITDIHGNETRILRDSAGVAQKIVAPFGLETSLKTESGMLSAIENANHESTGFTYFLASDGTNTGLLHTLTTPRKKVHTFDYDFVTGLLKTDSGPVEPGSPTGPVVALGRTTIPGKRGWDVSLTRNIDSGLSTTVAFSSRELPDGSTRHDVKGPSGLVTSSSEDPGGQQMIRLPDGTKVAVAVAGDPRFGLQVPVASTTVSTPGGHTLVTATSRSVAGFTDLFTYTSLDTVTDINKGTSTAAQYRTRYDPNARTLTTTSGEGRVSIATFDEAGHISKVEVGGGAAASAAVPPIFPITYTYEGGRTKSMTQGARKLVFTYDPASAFGFLRKVTDPLLQDTSFAKLDGIGRVKSAILPDSKSTEIVYDENGNVASITPPDRPAHKLDPNALDLLATYTPPKIAGTLDTATTYRYYLDRRPRSFIRPDEEISIVLDSSGRQWKLSHHHGADAGTTETTYHPVSGNVSKLSRLDGGATSLGVSLAYTYDGNLRTDTTWSGLVSGTVHHDFDNRFRVVKESSGSTLATASSVAFEYDRDGVATKSGLLTLTPDHRTSLITATTLAEGGPGKPKVTDASTYNSYGEPKTYASFWVSAGGVAIPIFASTFDGAANPRDKLGRITEKEETIQSDTTRHRYSYDKMGRLFTVTDSPTGKVLASYTYGKNGNRDAFTDKDGVKVTADYDEQDRLKRYGSSLFSYSLSGRRETRTLGADVTKYKYDALGGLLSVTLHAGAATEKSIGYLLDGHGRRVGRKADGKLMTYLYGGQLRIAATIDASGLLSQYVYAGRAHSPAYVTRGGKHYRIITDQLGSVRVVVALDGKSGAADIVQRMDYDAFGNVTRDFVAEGWEPVPFGFAGGLYDRDTGLVRLDARDYDPATGVWTAKDPLLFAAGGATNHYAYSGGDPVNQVDPLGLCVPCAAAAIEGAEVAAAAAGISILAAEVAPVLPEIGPALSDIGPDLASVVAEAGPELASLAAEEGVFFSRINWHHIFPVQYIDEFEEIGIDVHAWTIPVEERTHQMMHAFFYNDVWEMFFDRAFARGITPTEAEAGEVAIELLKRFGIWGPGGCKPVPYPGY